MLFRSLCCSGKSSDTSFEFEAQEVGRLDRELQRQLLEYVFRQLVEPAQQTKPAKILLQERGLIPKAKKALQNLVEATNLLGFKLEGSVG